MRVAANIPVQLVRVGYDRMIVRDDLSYEEVFYEMLKIPYEVRHSYFYIQRVMEQEERLYQKLNPNNEPYIFTHKVPDSMIKTDLKIIKNDESENVFFYGKLLQNAKEFHCAGSCLHCYAEQIGMPNTRLYFYNKIFKNLYRDYSNLLGPSTKENWEIV